ncbi:PREDICTED: UDP-glycosyltransferase 74G1 [Theobroma cacao]|uniref:Glycosyltransferase n=1 Tax=Theobroma cacao TaxID=3641 RepID=A0AB32W1V6_THECC|nr:PREDICTED: UDP-glycosyltransferase 74G1 [Theobroma cacao]
MEETDPKIANNAHVLILPYTAQGHINPMLQFAKRLVSKGLKATLVTSTFISKSMLVDPNTPIDIQSISDGFDEGGFAQAESSEDYLTTFQKVGSPSLATLMKKLGEIGRPVHALIYDPFLPWALDVAKQFGVAGVAFFTQSCAVNSIYYHVHKGLLQLPLSVSNVSLPGLPELNVSELPSYVSLYGSYPAFFDMVVNQFSNLDLVDWVLFDNFYELETQVVDWMSKLWKLGTIGPTLPSMYLDKRIEDDKDYGVNLFKPDTGTCMSWLNGKPKGSVVYASFGSMAEVDVEQMREIAWGLKGSSCYFLWVVRESEEAKLPTKFMEETSEKGLVVRWCSQLEVLSHESVGCFLTHCGLNSVMEAMCLGIPMVTLPQWTDQITNAKFVEDIWEVGIKAQPDEKGIVKSQAIELSVKEIMEGEKGKEIKKNANKWKNLAREAIDEGGSSDKHINQFVADLFAK